MPTTEYSFFDWEELDKMEEKARLFPCGEQSSCGVPQREHESSTKGPLETSPASAKVPRQELEKMEEKASPSDSGEQSSEKLPPQHGQESSAKGPLETTPASVKVPQQGCSPRKAVLAAATPLRKLGWEGVKARWVKNGLPPDDAEYHESNLKLWGYLPSDWPDLQPLKWRWGFKNPVERPGWMRPGQQVVACGMNCITGASIRDFGWDEGVRPLAWTPLTLKNFATLAECNFDFNYCATLVKSMGHWSAQAHRLSADRLRLQRNVFMQGQACGLCISGLKADGKTTSLPENKDIVEDAKCFMSRVNLRVLVVVKHTVSVSGVSARWEAVSDRIRILHFSTAWPHHGCVPHWLHKQDSKRLRQELEPVFQEAFKNPLPPRSNL